MKLVAYFAAVVSVIALALGVYVLNKDNGLAIKQDEIQKAIKMLSGSGDDQPVTISGGSLFLGNDPAASWKYGESGTGSSKDMWLDYAPTTATTPATGLLEITGTDTTASIGEFDYKVVRNNGAEMKIEIDYGPTTTTAQTLQLKADTTGTVIQARLFSNNAGTLTIINPKRFLRMLSFLRRHPHGDWHVQRVRVTGVVAQVTSPPFPNTGAINPKDGDLSMLLHYCIAGVSCQ